MFRHIDRRTRDPNAIDMPRSKVRTTKAVRDLPGGIIRRSRDHPHLVTFGDEAFAELAIVFRHSDQIGGIIDADQKNTHRAPPRLKFRIKDFSYSPNRLLSALR